MFQIINKIFFASSRLSGKKGCAVAFLIALSLSAYSQNKYGLKAMTFSEYKESIKTNPDKELIDLEKFVPGLVLDIRYATTNNFTKEKIYNLAKAYARKPVAESLKKVQEELKTKGTRN